MERMTNGQIPFHRERHDGQHRRVRSPVSHTSHVINVLLKRRAVKSFGVYRVDRDVFRDRGEDGFPSLNRKNRKRRPRKLPVLSNGTPSKRRSAVSFSNPNEYD